MATAKQIEIISVDKTGEEVKNYPVNRLQDIKVGTLANGSLTLPGSSSNERMNSTMKNIRAFLFNLTNVASVKREVSSSTTDSSTTTLATSKAVYDLEKRISGLDTKTDTANRAMTTHRGTDNADGRGSSTNYGHLKITDSFQIQDSRYQYATAADGVAVSQHAAHEIYTAHSLLNSVVTSHRRCNFRTGAGAVVINNADGNASDTKFGHVMLVNNLSSVQATGEKAIGETCFNQHTTLQAGGTVLGHVKTSVSYINSNGLPLTTAYSYEVPTVSAFYNHRDCGGGYRYNITAKEWKILSDTDYISCYGKSTTVKFGHVRLLNGDFYNSAEGSAEATVTSTYGKGYVPSAYALRRTADSILSAIADVRDNVALASTLTNHIGATATSEQWGHVKLSDSVNAALTAGSGWAATPALVNAVNVNAATWSNNALAQAKAYTDALMTNLRGGLKKGSATEYVGNAATVNIDNIDMRGGAYVVAAARGLCNTGYYLDVQVNGNLNFIPNNKDFNNCGTEEHRWNIVNTKKIIALETNFKSDRKLKKDIKSLDERWLKFFSLLKPVSYRYKAKDDNTGVRFGFIAQDVEAALVECGMNPEEFAMIQKEQDTVANGAEDDLVFDTNGDPVYTLYLNYLEYISILTAVEQNSRNELEKTKEELNDMKEELKAIKQALNLQ